MQNRIASSAVRQWACPRWFLRALYLKGEEMQMTLHTITFNQLVRSRLVIPVIALGGICFSLFNQLSIYHIEDDRIISVLLGLFLTAVDILVVWGLLKYWHYWYELITRTGSIWRKSFTKALYVAAGIGSVLICLPVIVERIHRILLPLNASYDGLSRPLALIGVSAWIVTEALVSVSLFISVVAVFVLGPTALWVNRKNFRLWWVNKCRCRGTCRYPRAPY